VLFVKFLPATKNLWQKVNLPFWTKSAIAGLLVGVVGIWIPDIFGTGLSQMKSIFAGTQYAFGALVVLAIAKLILTPTSLGSGFAGGVIGPALAIGSAVGLAFGELVARLNPALGISPIVFAMVATASMLAASFHAPLFGAFMVLEMSSNYLFLVPVLMGTLLSYAVSRAFIPGSAYTFALHGMGKDLQAGTFIVVQRDDAKQDGNKDEP
jgi:chloride channel protein, CIC family